MNTRLPPAWSKHLKAQPSPPAKQLQAKPLQSTTSRTQPDDSLLRQALELQQAGRLPEAEELCHRVLARTRNHPLALYILGTLGLGFDDELAIEYLSRAAAQEPNNPFYQLTLGEAWSKVGDYPPAIKHLQRSCELKPGLVEAHCCLGQAYARFDRGEMSLLSYGKALDLDRDHPLARTGVARTLINLGRMDEAATYLNENIARRVSVAQSYNILVGLRKFSSEPPELASILNELGNSAISAAEAHDLNFAAGKVLNDLGRYDEAMDHFLTARTFKVRDFDIDACRKRVDALISLFDPKLLAAMESYGDPSEAPVFVLGMPRSGTTLTEQICSSHPDVQGAGELTKLGRMAAAIGLRLGSTEAFQQTIRSMSTQQSQALAKDYLSNMALYASDASRIVDKMPHNFELIGLIAMIFPKARIIHCKRDAIDNCVSCFISNLQHGHSYSYDLKTLGLYYREYDRLMSHWKAVLPGRIFDNRYEDMISDQEGQSRRLIDHLGLPWDDACLRFFDRGGSVRTLSRWQVRQPIYTSSVKRWKHYESKIQPLIEALGDLADI
ncbi:sulfotransferase [Mesorhizobium sp. Root695]|uniref:tetratricopeptide repeat-containing sulfotransferase family protein n=1 Tax=Mesorhizobium sp. Root695 TaxID=1736589 RepID=UPI00070D075B|nr:sulfotransferase [Mesorhizobium sp. Root695]KRB30697.1 sulfotransferase [Mesorhizobium sp. Root695]